MLKHQYHTKWDLTTNKLNSSLHLSLWKRDLMFKGNDREKKLCVWKVTKWNKEKRDQKG